MALLNFIKDYQALIGSFLGLIFSVAFLYYKLYLEKKCKIENDKKEIEKIFFMAFRESEDAIKDLNMFISKVRNDLKNAKDEINVFIPPKFNRIYINEERLFTLSKDLSFIISQQVDIATSAVKKFNNDFEQLEFIPKFIFEGTIKILKSNLISKEKAINDYVRDQEKYLKMADSILNKDVKVLQRHLFRPIVALVLENKELNNIPKNELDNYLDKKAELLCVASKCDLN